MCDCGNNFTVEHACTLIDVQKGGFSSNGHSEICDLTVNLLREVYSACILNLTCNQPRQTQLSGTTANSQDGVRLDVSNGVRGGRYVSEDFS